MPKEPKVGDTIKYNGPLQSVLGTGGTVQAIRPTHSSNGRPYNGAEEGLTFRNERGDEIWAYINDVEVVA